MPSPERSLRIGKAGIIFLAWANYGLDYLIKFLILAESGKLPIYRCSSLLPSCNLGFYVILNLVGEEFRCDG